MRTTGFVSCFAFMLLFAPLPAQTPSTVTTTNGGTAGMVPVFTTGTNVENSPISILGSNVGIGTTSPSDTFVVSGNILSIGSNPGNWSDLIGIRQGSNTNYIQVDANGNTYFASNHNANFEFIGTAALFGGTNAGGVGIAQITAGGASPISNRLTYGTDGTGWKFAISKNQAGTITDQFVVQDNGSVGIGTTNPGAMLEVNGGIKLTGGSNGVITFQDGTQQATAFNPALCGGDYAESVDVTGKRAAYEPGDVLVIDPDAPGKFLKSTKPYSTLVAGVYSTKPGTVGRRQTTPKSPDEVPMALVGIVPVKVTAENGPIKPGDLLVTSSAPGRAMKGTDREQLTGAVIGKALGSLDSGDGVVEVLVSLR